MVPSHVDESEGEGEDERSGPESDLVEGTEEGDEGFVVELDAFSFDSGGDLETGGREEGS